MDGCTVKEAVAELPFSDAESVTEDWAVIFAAVAVNFAVAPPAATVTDAGAVSTELLDDDTATVEPAEGAAADRVIVQLEVLPDSTDAGAQASPVTVGRVGVTVIVDVAVLAFREAVTVAV